MKVSISEGVLGGCESWNESEIWWRLLYNKGTNTTNQTSRIPADPLPMATDLLVTESTEKAAPGAEPNAVHLTC